MTNSMHKGFSQNHRADLVWNTKKIVFEIQCSPIDVAILEKRSNFYRSKGYQIVWILHDKCFNRRFAGPAEISARCHAAYYTNISEEGIGIVYDQEELFDWNRRKRCSHKLPIDLKNPIYRGSALFFEGDHRLKKGYKRRQIRLLLQNKIRQNMQQIKLQYQKLLRSLLSP